MDDRASEAEAVPGRTTTGGPEAGGADREEVRRPGELWRIEGSLTAVRDELDRLESLDDERLRERIADLERRWRDELDAVLPSGLVGELHALLDWSVEPGMGASELRIALAQLEGWLDGVISGTALVVVEPQSG